MDITESTEPSPNLGKFIADIYETNPMKNPTDELEKYL